MCAGGRFRKVPESSAIEWCWFRRQVREASSGRFRTISVYAGVGSGGRFRKVLEGSGKFRRVPGCAGVGIGGFWKVPESSGVVCCLATLTGAAM